MGYHYCDKGILAYLTLVHAILNKARLCGDEKKSHELFLWAESEAKQEVSIMETKYGEISHKTALSHMLLADVYAEWKRYFSLHSLLGRI